MFSRRRLILSTVFLGGCSPYQGRSSPEQDKARQVNGSQLERRLFEAVNAVRVREGAPKLQWHAGAAAAAESHSRAMAQRDFFSHIDPKRGDLPARMKEAGVHWRLVAENLFEQRGCADAVQCAVDGWFNSPGHKRNLLNAEYTDTGIGIASNKRGTVYYTQIFLTP